MLNDNIFLQRVSLVLITLSSFLFVLTWQFSQFVLLLQAIALYGSSCLGMVPTNKVPVKFSYITSASSSAHIWSTHDWPLADSNGHCAVTYSLEQLVWKFSQPSGTLHCLSAFVAVLSLVPFTALNILALNRLLGPWKKPRARGWYQMGNHSSQPMVDQPGFESNF